MTRTAFWPGTGPAEPRNRCSTCARRIGILWRHRIRRIRRRDGRHPALVAGTGRSHRGTRAPGSGPAARRGARPRRQRRHHLHRDRPARRSRHQRAGHLDAGPVAPRRHPAAGLGGRLGCPGSRRGAALPVARRGALRPLRPAPGTDQRHPAPAAAVRPPRLPAGRPRNREPRPASAVPARLRPEPGGRRAVPGQRGLDAGAVGGGLRGRRPPGGRPRHPRRL